MKLINTIVIASALAAGSAGRTWAVTSEVFQVSAQITHSVLAGDHATNGVFRNAVIFGKDLVNLARGRNLGTTLPTNEVLALAHTCGATNAVLMVYDRYATNNLQTIAVLEHMLAANVPHLHSTSSEDLWSLNWADTGGVSNAVLGGQCFYFSSSLSDTNGCFRSLTGTAKGWFQSLVTPTFGTNHTPSNTTVLVHQMGITVYDGISIGHLAP